MRFTTKVLAIGMLALSSLAFAEEHPLSTIQGTNIDLKSYDHAFAGSIKSFVAFGAVDEESFSSDLTMRKDGQVIKATFARQADGKIGGMIQHSVESRTFETSIYFVKIEKETNTIVLTVNGQEVKVAISADGFENNHFSNPTYTAVVNGETISFTLHGKACFGYSLHLSMLILGAYLH